MNKDFMPKDKRLLPKEGEEQAAATPPLAGEAREVGRCGYD